MNLYNRESVCIRESKLDQYDLIEISGFQIFTLNTIGKKKNRSGGIAILVKDNICKYVEIFNGSSNDVLWFRLKKNILWQEYFVWSCLYCARRHLVFIGKAVNDYT